MVVVEVENWMCCDMNGMVGEEREKGDGGWGMGGGRWDVVTSYFISFHLQMGCSD